MPGGDPLGDDRGLRVLADVDHLRAGVGLLAVVRDGHRVELADRVVALQDAARVLPGDRRAGLDLGPGDLGAAAAAGAALGHEVVDAALAVLVARVPVLDRRVLDLGVVEGDELDDGGVELVLVADGGRAAFEVRHVRAFLGHDERALELAGVGGVDAEVGRELHRAPHALRDEAERAVGEDGGIERREVVVRVRHDRSEVLLDEVGVLLDRLGERAEDDSHLLELVAEGRRDRNRVEDGVDRHAGELGPLAQGDAELLVGLEQLRVDLFERLRPVLPGLRRRVVDDRLVVDRRVVDVLPGRLLHGEPVAVRLQAPLEHPLGLVLLRGDEPDDVLGEARRDRLRLDVGDEPGLVLALGQLEDGCRFGARGRVRVSA